MLFNSLVDSGSTTHSLKSFIRMIM